MHRLGDKLLVKTNGLNIQGHVVGLDHYHLENFEGTQHTWLSYTLTSDKGGLFRRYWITDWKKSGWFLWTACQRLKKPKFKRAVEDRSGIAQIKFFGDRGVSTPTAALAVYELENGEYYSTERFAGSDVMYFHAQNIQKPKIVK
jgi:hypothetical protein